MIFPELVLDIKNLIIISVTILHAALGIVISLRGPNKKQNITFALLELSLITWSVSMVFYRSSTGLEAIFWVKMLYLWALFIPYTFIYFLFTFPENRLGEFPKIYQFFMIVPVLYFVWEIFFGKFILGVKPALPEPAIIFNLAVEYAYATYIIIYFSFGYLRLFKLYRQSSGIIKTQARFLLLGTLIPTLLGTPGNLFLPLINIFYLNWSGQTVIVLMAVTIAYSIIKYNLLNIKVIATEVLTILINVFIIIRFVGSNTIADFFVNGIFLLGVAIFSILLIRSVQQEVRSRERIEQLAKDLEQANVDLVKLDEAKSEFISLASHQLRAPLTVIKGYTSMLLEGTFGEINKKAVAAIDRVFISANNLTKLVSDLLDLSRIESGKMKYEFKVIHLDDVVGKVLKELEAVSKEKRIAIEFKNENNKTFSVFGDADKLYEVVMNLLDNALKYSKIGPVIVTLTPRSKRLVLSVADRGMGIPQEEIPKLFQKFGRTDIAKIERPEGMGVGLYFVKRNVDDHKGRIWAESDGLGKGSTFFVELSIRYDFQDENEQFLSAL